MFWWTQHSRWHYFVIFQFWFTHIMLSRAFQITVLFKIQPPPAIASRLRNCRLDSKFRPQTARGKIILGRYTVHRFLSLCFDNTPCTVRSDGVNRQLLNFKYGYRIEIGNMSRRIRTKNEYEVQVIVHRDKFL